MRNIKLITFGILLVQSVAAMATEGPVKTAVEQIDGQYVITRDGVPYPILGAGIDHAELTELAARGGNSFRTWGTENAQEILDLAHSHGLTVALNLGVARERHGFDYDDDKAVREQFERLKAEVLQFRNHPALLAWIIGNELNYDYKNPKVYDAVNELSKMIHSVDPNHPTTTTLAGFSEEMIATVNERAPDLDFISIQAYGSLAILPKFMRQTQFARPYMVTEWGSIGHWEMPKTIWDAPIEQTSSEKAGNYQLMHDKVIAYDSPYNLGAYVFFWGQKQERTPTWYGLFMPTGESTEALDVVQRAWTGNWPENRAPRVISMRLNNRTAHDNVVLKPGETYKAQIRVKDPNRDEMRFLWEIREESLATQVGGDKEEIPALIPDSILGEMAAKVEVRAPVQPGAYRIFVFVYDGKGSAAHANIPFFVQP